MFGWVEDLPSFYCALDVLFSASHTESFGLAIAEALASGTAVVATRTEGAEEILAADGSGLLVPVKDGQRPGCGNGGNAGRCRRAPAAVRDRLDNCPAILRCIAWLKRLSRSIAKH